MTDDLEPFTGRYDWAEAVRQNPEQGVGDLPDEAVDAVAGVLAEDAEEWLSIAHLDLDLGHGVDD
jgi:hypothetical protein